MVLKKYIKKSLDTKKDRITYLEMTSVVIPLCCTIEQWCNHGLGAQFKLR